MSDDPLLWLLLLQLVFIFLNAIFSCAEIAVITMNDNKLARLVAAGDKRALRLQKLTEQPSRFLATIQVGITLVSLLSSAVAAENFSDRLAKWFESLGLSIPDAVLQHFGGGGDHPGAHLLYRVAGGTHPQAHRHGQGREHRPWACRG